jgi:CBS domain-containing protein
VGLLAKHKIGSLPVTSHGKVVGIMSERDVIYCLAREGEAVLDRKVEEVMTAPAITVTPEISVLAALSNMSRRRIRHLPVVAGERLIGIVSIGDLVAYRIARIEQEAEAMRSYIQSA